MEKIRYIRLEKINDTTNQIWKTIDKGKTVDDLFGTENFSGVTLFKNYFQVDDVNEMTFLSIQPKKDLPWGLWEYDIYINSNKLLSSLISIKKEDISLIKSIKLSKLIHLIYDLEITKLL